MICLVQVHVELGPASEGIAHLAQQGVRWDLAFIDADKTGYLGYYKQVCNPSGMIKSQVFSWTNSDVASLSLLG